MPDEKLTEEQIRHNIRRKFDFSETTDKDRIDKVVEMEKDRFKAVQKKVELKKQLESGKPEGKKDPDGNYTLEDHRAVAKVPDEDYKDFMEIAERLGLSPGEAYENKDVQTLLKGRQEERKASDAINTGKKRGGSSKIDGHKALDDIIKNPKKEVSQDEMDAIVEAKWQAKHPKK